MRTFADGAAFDGGVSLGGLFEWKAVQRQTSVGSDRHCTVGDCRRDIGDRLVPSRRVKPCRRGRAVDYPARIEAGRVVARLKDAVPGPEEPVEMKLPSETGGIVGVDFLPHDVLVPTGV